LRVAFYIYFFVVAWEPGNVDVRFALDSVEKVLFD